MSPYSAWQVQGAGKPRLQVQVGSRGVGYADE